jgi:hypothetical protein
VIERMVERVAQETGMADPGMGRRSTKVWTWQEVRGMPEGDLMGHIYEVQADLDAIKGQIQTAINRFHAEGQRSDTVWFNKVRKAYRHKVLQHTMMREALRFQRREVEKLWSEEFVRIARGVLATDQWEYIHAKANEEISAFRQRRAGITAAESGQLNAAPQVLPTG